MNISEDPIRLRTLVGRTSALRRGIEAAQASGPTDEQLKALEHAVLGGVAASAATAVLTATVQATHPAAAVLSWGTAKLVLCLAIGASMGAGVTLVWHKGRGSHSASVNATVAATVKPTQELVPPSLQPTLSEPTPALLPAETPANQPVVAPSRAIKPKARTPSRDPAPDAEVPLLEQAHRALSESPSLALKLAREHERRFPSSTLDQERELIEVTALVDLGRLDEASRLAQRFSEQHPGSAYVGRIDRIVRQQGER